MMLRADANLQTLVGGLRLKVRIQHPDVHERTDRRGSYWFFRYWDDVLQSDGTTKAIRKFQTLGPSKGENRLTKKQAEVARDKFLAKLNKPSIHEKVADGLVLFSKMVEKYRSAHVEAEVDRLAPGAAVPLPEGRPAGDRRALAHPTKPNR